MNLLSKSKPSTLGVMIALLILASPAHAQWITQTAPLSNGWNAVYLHVDASDALLDDVMAAPGNGPVQEIWLWQPGSSTLLFSGSPAQPVADDTHWVVWRRSGGSTLSKLVGNAAYLVRVAGAVNPYQWGVKGRPLAPSYQWTVTGLNFVGFPTPPQAPPFFTPFLQPAPSLRQNSFIYHYPAGASNPAPLLLAGTRTYNETPVRRHQAYWVDTTNHFNRYFGPFQLLPPTAAGLQFRDTLGQATCRLRNLTAASLTVTLRMVASELPGSTAGVPLLAPPVLVRGSLNISNLTYDFTALAGNQTHQWTLAPAGQPGSELEVVLGVDRSNMNGAPGQLYAGILRFTDSLNLSQIDIGVSAEVVSSAGLWVGGATVSGVEPYLRRYKFATSSNAFWNLTNALPTDHAYSWESDTHRVLVTGGPEGYRKVGAYLTEDARVGSSTVARPYPLRLIVHNDGTTTRLLRQVFHGLGQGGSNQVLTTRQALLHAPALASARRITAAHQPVDFSPLPEFSGGAMAPGNTLTALVAINHDDQASNPFLHTYHPDHDNLNALYDGDQPQGLESYRVERQMTLSFTPTGEDFASRTTGPQMLSGAYFENVTFAAQKRPTGQDPQRADRRTYTVSGIFALQRISSIPTLTP
jgi:hypothetical protein